MNILFDNQLLAIISMGLTFVIIITLTELVRIRFNLNKEYARKFIHFTVGMICILTPARFTNHWYVFSSTITFSILILVLRKVKIVGALHKIDRISNGDLLLPIVIYLNYLLFKYYNFEQLFLLPLLILSISDPAAFIGGDLFHKTKKSLPGSITFFITTIITCFVFFLIIDSSFDVRRIWLVAICSILGTLAEAIGTKGWDNLTIPLTIGTILTVYTELIA